MIRVWPWFLLLAACPAPRQECNSRPSTVELRDGKGVLLIAAKPGAAGLDVCDPSHGRLASIRREGELLTLLDRGGAPRLLIRRVSPDDLAATGPDSQVRLRVHREGPELFVLDPQGVRLGTLVDGAPARVFDRLQTPWGTVEARGPDQAIRDPEGTTLYLVQPAASSQLAGLFTVAGLDRAEQLALYILLAR
jgi:hypothetical protein